MPNKTGIAVIGSGDIARIAHLPAWAAETRAEVVSIVDADEQVARAVAEQWQVSHWSTDYHEVLQRDDVDAVDVCLPGRLHADCVVASLAAGKDVLVEKPVALTLEDTQRMADAQQSSGRVLMVAENWPYSSAYRNARQALSNGLIGAPLMLHAVHFSDLRISRPGGAGRGDRDYVGYFFAAGVHAVNLAREIMGPIGEVFAVANASVPGPVGLPLDDDLVLAARFERGGIGSLTLSGRSRHIGPRQLGFRVLGEQGVIEFDIWGGWLEVTSGGSKTRTELRTPSAGYAEEIAHFVDCVHHGEEPLTSIPGQLETLAAVFAGYRSVAEQRAVRPKELLGGLTGA